MKRDHPKPGPRSAAFFAAACACLLAACDAESGDTAPLGEDAQEEIVGSDPVDDHEPGDAPDAINDPVEEGPPLINRTGPDRDEGVDVEIQP